MLISAGGFEYVCLCLLVNMKLNLWILIAAQCDEYVLRQQQDGISLRERYGIKVKATLTKGLMPLVKVAFTLMASLHLVSLYQKGNSCTLVNLNYLHLITATKVRQIMQIECRST